VKTYWLIVAHNPKMSVGGGGGVKLRALDYPCKEKHEIATQPFRPAFRIRSTSNLPQDLDQIKNADSDPAI
jgi:hypothetical protein